MSGYKVDIPLLERALAKKSMATANSKNITYKKPKSKKNAKKAKVGKSFKLAYYKMLPTKEIRFKHALTTSATDTMAARMIATRIDNIVQGTQLDQRIGNKIYYGWLHVRGCIQNNSTTRTKFLRMIVLKERNYGSLNLTTYADLYDVENGFTTDQAPTGIQTDAAVQINRDKYIPLYDKVIKIKIESEDNVFINRKIRIGKTVTYPQASSSSNDTIHGRLYFITDLFDGDNATAGTTVITNFGCRGFFKDYKNAV